MQPNLINQLFQGKATKPQASVSGKVASKNSGDFTALLKGLDSKSQNKPINVKGKVEKAKLMAQRESFSPLDSDEKFTQNFEKHLLTDKKVAQTPQELTQMNNPKTGKILANQPQGTSEQTILRESLRIGVPKEQTASAMNLEKQPHLSKNYQAAFKANANDGSLIRQHAMSASPKQMNIGISEQGQPVNPMARNYGAKMPERSIFVKKSAPDQNKLSKSLDMNEGTERKSFFPKQNGLVDQYQAKQLAHDNNVINMKSAYMKERIPAEGRISEKISSKHHKAENLFERMPVGNEVSSNLSPERPEQTMVTSKTLNMGQMNINSSNPDQLIEQISNYVTQSNFQNRDKLEVTVLHKDLGQFKIQVHKDANQMDMGLRIVTNSRAGHEFFIQHESQLMNKLHTSGLNVSEIKISQTFETLNFERNSNSSFGENFSGRDNGYYGRQGQDQQQQDSQRRRNLWEDFKQRYEA